MTQEVPNLAIMGDNSSQDRKTSCYSGCCLHIISFQTTIILFNTARGNKGDFLLEAVNLHLI